MRRIAGVVLGVVAAIATVFVIEGIGHALFPSSAGGGAGDPQVVARLPLGAKLMVLLGWFVGALAGGIVGLRLSRWSAAPWLVAAVLVASGVATLFMLPHPWWMQVSAVALPLLGALIASRTAKSAASNIA